MRFLKQSTAVTVKIGPFLDDADGKTAETSLSISQSDTRLSKNGGDFVQKNDSSGATHDENGYYDIQLSAVDTETAGALRVAIHKTGALPVWEDFAVVATGVYDLFFSSNGLYEKAAKLLVNKAVQTKVTGAIQYYDYDGQSIILTHTPTEDESTVSRTPS